MPKVKICGNKNPLDVEKALECGADYIGLIFAPSKRLLSINQAKEIISVAPTFDSYVGVFLNQQKEEVLGIAESLKLNYLQFHGDETALYCDYFHKLGYKVIKTFHIKDEMSLKRVDGYSTPYAFLYDTFTKDRKGGSGVTFDWSLLSNQPHVQDRLFLAGGLTIDNLTEAIKTVKPYAVDVSSGIEKSVGCKDHDLMKSFIQIAKKFEEDSNVS